MEVVTLEFYVVYVIITSLNITASCDNFWGRGSQR